MFSETERFFSKNQLFIRLLNYSSITTDNFRCGNWLFETWLEISD